MKLKYYQDGGRFYSDISGILTADYSHLVRGDYDLKGAEIARAQFLRDFPQFTITGDQNEA